MRFSCASRHKSGSVIGGKSPSPVFRWSGGYYTEPWFNDKLRDIAFIIECDSSAILNTISHSPTWHTKCDDKVLLHFNAFFFLPVQVTPLDVVLHIHNIA